MILKNKTILVTGGAGFLGSHLVEKLVEKGNHVKVLDHFSTGRIDNLKSVIKHIEVYQGDVGNIHLLDEALKDVDIVFHLAAHADIKNNKEAPLVYYNLNLLPTCILLECMRKNNKSILVFASSAAIYGDALEIPTPEHYCSEQTSMYGAAKYACEGLLQAYESTFKFSTYSFRFTSIMGERYSHGCVKDFYDKLTKDNKNITIYGNGEQAKSYIYVKDAVDAMVMAVEEELPDIYNVSNLSTLKTNDVLKIVQQRMKTKAKINYTPTWAGDSPTVLLDVNKLRDLGWEPSMTPEETVKQTIDWVKENERKKQGIPKRSKKSFRSNSTRKNTRT